MAMAIILGLLFSYGMVAIAPFLREWQHLVLGAFSAMLSALIGSVARRDGRRGLALLAVVTTLFGVSVMFSSTPSGVASGAAVLCAAMVALGALLTRWRVRVVFTRRPLPGEVR